MVLVVNDEDEAECGGVMLADEEQRSLQSLPVFSDVKDDWTKACEALKTFGFLHIYSYLVESRDDTFDQRKKEAYRTLIGYCYHADELVRNVWCRTFTAEKMTMLHFKPMCMLHGL